MASTGPSTTVPLDKVTSAQSAIFRTASAVFDLQPAESQNEASRDDDDSVYSRYSALRKWMIVLSAFLLSLTMTFSTSSLLPAIPEISEEFGTTGAVISYVNAGYLICTGASALIWGPLNQVCL